MSLASIERKNMTREDTEKKRSGHKIDILFRIDNMEYFGSETYTDEDPDNSKPINYKHNDHVNQGTSNEISRRRRQRTVHDSPGTPLIPYGRVDGFYNDTAHIRWTSSNFLHSGSWESHRDDIWLDNIDLFKFLIIIL
ncbi:hypothetical protein RhiirC2_718432 [Rhizophagus irregularis]|uniref:Uncharacterized protein n=1 Tax=Rhizophagus irregularis TaxID=588596 RepID=A0A2N1MII8_9GLOM|nr:hypothetical protein RhiirC2_718432 [Rhizophagus irregularis]